MGRFARDTVEFFVIRPGPGAFVLSLIAAMGFMFVGYVTEALVHAGLGVAISWVGIGFAWLMGWQLLNMFVRDFVLGQDTSDN